MFPPVSVFKSFPNFTLETFFKVQRTVAYPFQIFSSNRPTATCSCHCCSSVFQASVYFTSSETRCRPSLVLDSGSMVIVRRPPSLRMAVHETVAAWLTKSTLHSRNPENYLYFLKCTIHRTLQDTTH